MCRKLLAVAVALGLLLIAPAATAEPLHTLSGMQCTTEAGSKLTLPPSHILSEPDWDALDERFRRLEDAETRLLAENVSLHEDAQPAWQYVAAALIVGIAAGAYAFRDQ